MCWGKLVQAVEEEKPDAVVIAGDLYDRAVPPTEAVSCGILETLARIVISLGTPVLGISGNHDSPSRISFGTRMMESRGLHRPASSRVRPAPVVLGRSSARCISI